MLGPVLVANRGEIAVRILRTLRANGATSVAVYSEADRDAPHVRLADEAVLLGAASAVDSYLSIERVLAACAASGAGSVHPGYGFLAENAAFARAVEDAGLVFIGPSSDTIALMGDKSAAKEAVAPLGVPLVPGFDVGAADDDEVAARCAEVGWPVIVKPAAGGGGKGMRVVGSPAELPAALASARREASAAFGDDALLIERYLPRARHVEVQVLGDGEGDAIHLGDRDCSLQRRHQKVIEEAPAPHLPDSAREGMRAHSVAIARAVRYRGVGTVEFVVDADEPTTYYFLEMNTRLQVEHPVTELVTGQDLVALQLRVAAHGALPLRQEDVVIRGHAVEARVYAEDGHRGFLPSSGTVLAYREPAGARVDSGIEAGSVVGTWYDPLLLKVVTQAGDRRTALASLDAALGATLVLGVPHNVGALRALVQDMDVRRGRMTTSLIGELGLGSPLEPDPHRDAAAVLVAAERGRGDAGVWTAQPGWRVGEHAAQTVPLVDEDGRAVEAGDGELAWAQDGRAVVTLHDTARTYDVAWDQGVLWLGRGGDSWQYRFDARDMMHRPGEADDGDGALRSPMPGTVVVACAPGDAVLAGEPVVVIEAMKMEYPLVAPFDGVVAPGGATVGAQVARDQVVAMVEPAP